MLPGDCLDVMPTLPAASVSLIVADPPYHRVKMGEAWDRQWKDDAAYLAWIGRLCAEWRRVLKPSGSLYCFASPRLAARIECKIGEAFRVLNRITWRKDAGWARKQCKDEMRAYWPASEAIVFAEPCDVDNFEPLRAYLERDRIRAGVRKEDCNVACGFSPLPGGMASRHYFGRSQWQLPTAEHYMALRELFNRIGPKTSNQCIEYLRRDYDDLRREYEALRRPFAVSADVPHTDVWDFATVPHRPGKHPCEKPLALIEHVVATSSRPGDVVLDPFAGSGVAGEACRKLGRQAVLIERDPRWVGRIAGRLAIAYLPLFSATA